MNPSTQMRERTISIRPRGAREQARYMTLLSELCLAPEGGVIRADRGGVDPYELRREDREGILRLASSHHVVVRAFEKLRRFMVDAGSHDWTEWIDQVLEAEHGRIRRALTFLSSICETLNAAGCEVVVIKSLDHWPDLGSDLDLFSGAKPSKLLRTMKERFQATLAPRSWGDRLAGKWNFVIPGLDELVEVHVGRLGQTGEHVHLARTLTLRAAQEQRGEAAFPVPAVEDRLILATLQRMYRHFYLRLCDIVNTKRMVEVEVLDYGLLRSTAEAAGIWHGVATYLVIVSDYIARFRGEPLEIPSFIRAAARFGERQVSFGKGFLRIPIVPYSARLYASQLLTLMAKRQFAGTARLSLLPGLATAAAVDMAITGSDKGIW
jgi:hypothetical protein